MPHKRRLNGLVFLFGALSLVCTNMVWATSDTKSKLWNANLYFENDLFAETDQNYTNGIRFALVSPDLKDFKSEKLNPWLDAVSEKLDFLHPESQGCTTCGERNNNIVFSIGQTMFTPTTIDATELLEDERPYAGWLFLGLAFHSRSELSMNSFELQTGIVGPSARGKEAQDWVHDVRGFDRFLGWHNQLRDEIGINVIYEHKRKHFLYESDTNLSSDVIGHAGWSLGNVATYANLGAELRFGRNIPNDFGTSAVRSGGDNSAPYSNWQRSHDWGLHGFVSFDARLVARDIFLDGNTFKSSHSVDKETFVVDAAIGLSFTYDYLKVSYAHIFRTKEFEGQPHPHNYGSLSIALWGFFE